MSVPKRVQAEQMPPNWPHYAYVVGREQELATLKAWWHRTDGCPAFVVGPAEIGKTSLLNLFAWTLSAPVAWRTLAVAYGTLKRWRSANMRPLPSGVPSLLVIDEVDNGGLDMLEHTVSEIRAVSPSTRIVAAGRMAPPAGDWHHLPLGPMTTDDIGALLLAQVERLSEVPFQREVKLLREAVPQISPLIRGNPGLARTVWHRVLHLGPSAVAEILRGLNWDETALLQGVDSPAVASELDIRIQSVGNALVHRLAAQPDLLFELRPRQLEELMAELYARQGFEVELTPQTNDGGVDLYLVQHTAFGRLLTIVDCKRNRVDRPVKVEVVRQMLGTIEATGASAGVLATTSRFTSGAIQLARKYPFRLGLQDYFDLHSMLRNATRASGPT